MSKMPNQTAPARASMLHLQTFVWRVRQQNRRHRCCCCLSLKLVPGAPPCSNAETFASVVSLIARRASRVKNPWCAVISTFGNVSSLANTSS